MPSPSELRALAERANDDEAPDAALCDRMRRELSNARNKRPTASMAMALGSWALINGDILIRQAEYVPALADAVLEQQNRIEELERENERLRSENYLLSDQLRSLEDTP